MKVKVRFFGFLAKKIGKQIEIDVGEEIELGEAVAQVFHRYGLGSFDPKSLSAKANLTPSSLRVFLNGSERSFSQKLRDGDEILVLPPLVGGGL